jgi:hypothetical protein
MVAAGAVAPGHAAAGPLVQFVGEQPPGPGKAGFVRQRGADEMVTYSQPSWGDPPLPSRSDDDSRDVTTCLLTWLDATSTDPIAAGQWYIRWKFLQCYLDP